MKILTILKSIRVRHFIYLMICVHALTSLYLHSAVLNPPDGDLADLVGAESARSDQCSDSWHCQVLVGFALGSMAI